MGRFAAASAGSRCPWRGGSTPASPLWPIACSRARGSSPAPRPRSCSTSTASCTATMLAGSGPCSWRSCGPKGGTWSHDPRRSAGADARAHAVPVPPPAHAGGRGGDARLRGEVRRGPGALGDRGPAARLRLRALSQRRALAHRRAPELGRAAVARQGAPRVAVPRDPGARELQRRAARHDDGEDVVRRGRAVRLPRRLRAGAPVQELRRPRGLLREEEAQGQGVRPRREPGGGAPGSRGAGLAAGGDHRLRDSSAAPDRAHAGARRGVSLPAARGPALVAERDELALAMDRACGARPIEGNSIELYSESPRALDAMLELIARAERWVHFENYIIRGDRTGRRFADALEARARAGVPVRVLYDALGSLGTPRRFWRRLRQAGVEVRAFHPLLSLRPFELLSRDHRKLVVADGTHAMTGGLCVGDEWAGDPARRRLPWRDTMLPVRGSAGAALGRPVRPRLWVARRPPPPPPVPGVPPPAGARPA